MPGRKQATKLAILTTAAALAYLGFAVAQAVKPLDEAGIVKLIEIQFGDKGLIAKLKKDGINFTVDDASVERLKKAGASDAVLEAVREVGKKPSSAPPAAPATIKAVTYDDVMQFLQFGLAEPHIIERLEKSPIIFTLGADQIEALKKAGASEKLLAAMQGKREGGDVAKEITDLAIILDCSYSMGEKAKDGSTKMTVAKQVVIKLIEEIPDGLNLAFIIYGQDKSQGCKAVRVVRRMSPLDAKGKAELGRTIGNLQPVGNTPIALALEAAGAELGRDNAPGGLVLISDGMETCHGNPAAVAATLARNPNLSFGVNVIGFDVQDGERKAVEEIARAGKGKYYDAGIEVEFRNAVAALHKSLLKRPARPVQTRLTPTPTVIKPVDLKDLKRDGDSAITSLSFSPDGSTLVWSDNGQRTCLWDLAEGKKRADLEHDLNGRSQAISPDGKLLVLGTSTPWVGGGNLVYFWDAETGETLRKRRPSWSNDDHPVTSIAFSPDGKHLASVSFTQCVILWDIALRDERLVLKDENTAKVSKLVFSPDSKTMATGSTDGTLRLYGVEDWKVRATFRARPDKENSVHRVAFTPDGKTLVEASNDQTVRLWDIATEKVRTTLEGHQERVLSLAISADGRFLASGSYDQTVILWDLARGKRLTTLKGHTNWVGSVVFSPDGRTLATGGGDATVKIWDLSGLVGPAH